MAVKAEAELGRLAYPVREVAAALGVSENVIRKQIQRGKLASVRVGGKVYVPASVLRVLMAGKEA